MYCLKYSSRLSGEQRQSCTCGKVSSHRGESTRNTLHHVYFKTIVFLFQETHRKTSEPQPATAVKNRGPRSRAGLIGQPQFRPMDTAMAMMTRPMHRGSTPFGAPRFFLSVMARMHRMSAAVPITWKQRERKVAQDHIGCWSAVTSDLWQFPLSVRITAEPKISFNIKTNIK